MGASTSSFEERRQVSGLPDPATRLPPLPEPNQGDGVVIEPPYFTISWSHDTRVVVLAGELDLATAPELEKVLSHFESGSVTIDMSEVTFIDAAVLGILMKTNTRLRRAHGKLTVFGARPLIQRLFGLTGLTDVFPSTQCDS